MATSLTQGVFGTKGRQCICAASHLSSKRNGSTTTSTGIPSPNQFTTAFQEVKRTCPQYMEAYATCVMQHHHAGTLEKHCCEEEFRQLKDCFKRCRRPDGD